MSAQVAMSRRRVEVGPGARFPGGLPHHRRPPWREGHLGAFQDATVARGEPASCYFHAAGLSALAARTGGLCTFWMGEQPAIYQVTNDPLVDDEMLAPSTDSNSELFGDFMGALPAGHPERPAKRAVVERVLNNSRFIDALEPEVRRHAASFLREQANQVLPLDEFALSLVAHVDSYLPGVIDLRQRPLTSYLDSADYGGVVRRFFEIASDVIANVNPAAMKEFDVIVPFVRDVLTSNLASIAAAPSSNLIKAYFALWGCSLTPDGVRRLTTAQLKELGTILVAVYDTTALSLLWALAYLETTPHAKAEVLAAVNGAGRADAPIGVADLAVLEAVRLGGSNPTALWRRTTEEFTLSHGEQRVVVPAGAMIWLDRRRANQDPGVFRHPDQFSLDNIRAIVRSDRETISSLLSRNRYEINSFSMINTRRNPRKCPGRLFSVRTQSILLSEIYGSFDVEATGVDTRLRYHSSMPRPAAAGTVRIRPRFRSSEGTEGQDVGSS